MPLPVQDSCRSQSRPHYPHRGMAWTLTLSAVVLSATALAQTLTWDASGTAPVNGGAGTWDTTSLRWHNGSYQAWNNAALSDALFAGTAGTVTLGTPITVHNLAFNTTGYTLSGNTLTLAGVNPTITTNSATTTVNSILAGSSGLVKAGAGTLVLAGVNTYSGLTVVQAGTLSITNNAALGSAPNIAANLVLANGATLNFNATTLNRDFTLAGGIVNLAASTGTLAGSPTLTASTELRLSTGGTFSGALADTGANVLSLTKAAAGTAVLTGVNTYSGPTQLSAGILRAGSANALSVNSNLVLSGSAILELAAGDLTRAVGTGPNEIQFSGSAGFGALGATRIINLGGAGATLGWGTTPGFLGPGQSLILSSASSTATVDFRNALDLNGDTRTIQINNPSVATDAILSGVLANGGVTYSGAGTVLVSGANTYEGATTLNGASVRVTSIGNANTSGGLGAAGSDASNLVFNSNASVLTYAGAGESTDRDFSFAAATQASIAASGTGALIWNGAPEVASGARTVILRGTSTAANTFAGLLSDGGGTLSLTKADAGTWRLAGSNTYSGTTSITGGTLEIDMLADGGATSSLGGSSNAAANLTINSSGLRYVGAANSATDRNFTGITAPRIESNGAGALTWNGSMSTIGAATLTLGGTNTGANLFAGTLSDFNTGVARTGLIKAGTGTWALSGANLYTADTRLDAGLLRLEAATALPGGTAAGGTSQGSLLNFNGGVLGLTSSSGDFNRDVGTAQFLNNVRWQGSGGFAAFGGDRVVALGGAAATLSWTAAGFVPNGQSLILGHVDADSAVDFRNPISFGTAARTVLVNDGAAATDALLSGVLSSTSTGGGLVKAGTGRLVLTANNTYTGATTISAGVLQVGSAGTTGTLGSGAITNNAQLAIDRSDAYAIGQVMSGTGSLRQAGGGTTTLTGANTYSGATFIDAGALQIGNGGTTGTVGAGAITNNSALIINRSNALSMANAIAGSGVLRHQGAGTTTLSGNSSFTGPIELNAGAIAVGNLQNGGINSNLGASSSAAANLLFDGGTLRYTGAARSTDRNFLIADGGATLDGSGTGTLTWTGAPSFDAIDQARTLTLTGTTNGNVFAGSMNDNGTGALTLSKTGAGRWVLAADNNYTGTTSITAGTLQIGNAGNSGTLGTGSVVNNGTLTFLRSDAFDVANTISGAGIITQAGNGTTRLTGSATATATSVTAGTLRVSGVLTTSTLALTGTLDVLGIVEASGGTRTTVTGTTAVNTLRVTSGATLRLTGDLGAGADVLDISGLLDMGAGTLSLGNDNDTFTVRDGASTIGTVNGGSGANTLNADIAANAALGSFVGFQTLTKSGVGVLNLSAALTGITTLNANAGTVNFGSTASAAGIVTTNIASGATLNVDGSYAGSAATDTWAIAGTVSGGGTLDLGAGNDVLRLNDGAVLNTVISGGAHTSSDSIVLNNAAALSFNAASVAGFERLTKQNSGVATLTGTHSYTAGTTLTSGTLAVGGTLNSSTLSIADGAALHVAGTVQNAGAMRIAITGSNGENSIFIDSGAVLRATGGLGLGADVLDVAGLLDLGTGTFDLGAGDDIFTVHDGTSITGTVAGGTGINTFNTDIAGIANLGAVTGFQSLLKTGTGTLNVNGSAASSFTIIGVDSGTLNVAATGSIAGVGSTSVADGATLNVLGAYSGTAAADSFSLTGTVSGTGTVALGTGDDVLTLNDGAVLNTVVAGGTHTSGDTLVLNNAFAFSLAGAATSGFERLTKQNSGIATLTSTHSYAATALGAGALAVNGTLNSPTLSLAGSSTLDVRGTVQAAAGAAATLAGDAGDSTITVAIGGTLRAIGDLGDGSDVVDVSGTLNTGAGTLSLGNGDDTLTIHDGTNIVGSVVGGGGINTFNTDIATTASFAAVSGFQSLLKSGIGTLNMNGPAAATFGSVNVAAGALSIGTGATITGVANTMVASGASLTVNGSALGTAGDDQFTVAGTLNGMGSADLGDGADVLDVLGTLNLGTGSFSLGAGDDTLTIHDGTSIVGTIVGGSGVNTFHTDIDTLASLGAITDFQSLLKTGSGVLTIDGPSVSNFGIVAVDAGSVAIGATGSIVNVTSTSIVSGATLEVNGSYAGTSAADVFELRGTLAGSGTVDLGAGDDVLSINDGAALTVALHGGAQTTADSLSVNNVAALSLGDSYVSGFEQLTKNSMGALTLAGSHVFAAGTAVTGGELAVEGDLETSGIAMSNDSVLHIGGVAQAAGSSAITVTGGAGVNVVRIGQGAVLRAAGDLGDGGDLLDVHGLLDTDGAVLTMGDGDDMLTVHDDAIISGTVVGGAGTNTLNADISTAASLVAMTDFQRLAKSGAGTLSISAPAVAAFHRITADAGTLRVDAGASLIGIEDLEVAAGATIRVDGALYGTAGGDRFSLLGTLVGTGAVDLGDGADVFVIHDGAILEHAVSGSDGVDTLVLDSVNLMTFDGIHTSGFEALRKLSDGSATIAGVHSFDTVGVEAGTLVIGGVLQSSAIAVGDVATFEVAGNVAGFGAPVSLTGSAGANTVRIAANANLFANGSLGAGADTLDVAGALNTDGFSLGDGDDTLMLHDGSLITGPVDAGGGLNTLNTNIVGTADIAALSGFQGLLKTGRGTLNINGVPASQFNEVTVTAGAVNVGAAASVTGVRSTRVGAGAVLNVDGGYTGTPEADAIVLAGRIAGSGTINMGEGNDLLMLRDGASLDAVVDGSDSLAAGDVLILDRSSAASLSIARATGFEILSKRGVGTVTLLDPAVFADAIEVQAGTLVTDQALSAARIGIAHGASLMSAGSIVGDVHNAGVLAFQGAPFGRLTIRGNYVGADGRIDLRVALADEGSHTDVLAIDGGSATGTTRLRIINQDGLGARTQGSGIQLVETSNGATTSDDAFVLDGQVLAGAYRYELFHGTADDLDPQGWFLRSLASVRDAASLSTTLVPIAHKYGLALIGSLHEREGTDLRTSCDGSAVTGCQWGRIWHRGGKYDGGGTEINGASFDYDVTGFQIGTDLDPDGGGNAANRGGVYLNAGTVDADAKRDDGESAGDVKTKAYSLGAYWTHRDPQQWYVDGSLLWTYFDGMELEPREDSPSVAHAWSLAASFEAGRGIRLGSRATLEAQLQMVGQHIKQDAAEVPGAEIDFGDANTLAARAGLAFALEPGRVKTWMRADYWKELSGDTHTALAAAAMPATRLKTQFAEAWLELSAGLAMKITENGTVHADVTATQGMAESDSRALQGTLGFRLKW